MKNYYSLISKNGIQQGASSLQIQFLVSIIIVMINFTDLFSMDSLKYNRIQFGLTWKVNAPHLRPRSYTKDELWGGVYRIGLELEYGRKLLKRFEGTISFNYIDSRGESKEKTNYNPQIGAPFFYYRKSYRLKTVNLGLAYTLIKRKINLRYSETLGISKVNYSFLKGLGKNINYGDILNGYDIAYIVQNKVTLHYPIRKWSLNFIYFSFSYSIYVSRTKGIIYDSYASTEPRERYNPPKSLTSGLYLNAGIGKNF